MKKMLLILFMLGLCAAFYFMVSNDKLDLNPQNKKVDVLKQLEEHNKELDNAYPSTPKALIELNNKLMSYLYSTKIQESQIDLYIDTVRRLYDQELLELNTKEDQKNAITVEMLKSTEENTKFLGSKIEDVTLLGDTEAEVKVTHYRNKENVTRIYKLTHVSGVWKIISWENLKADSNNSEE